jgi:hypothetical protein
MHGSYFFMYLSLNVRERAVQRRLDMEAYSAKMDLLVFADYKRAILFVKETGLRPKFWESLNPGYDKWVCPILRPKDPRIQSIKCPHPAGYHEWLEANPWVNTIRVPPSA